MFLFFLKTVFLLLKQNLISILYGVYVINIWSFVSNNSLKELYNEAEGVDWLIPFWN